MRASTIIQAHPKISFALCVALLVSAGWVIEHRGCIIWDRHTSVSRRTFIHGTPGNYVLNDLPQGSIGQLRICRRIDALSQGLFFVEIAEFRTVRVNLKDEPFSRSADRQWRLRAFQYFGTPSALLPDYDGSRTLRFGFPGEVLPIALSVLGIVVIPLLIIQAIRVLNEYADPNRRREAFLRRHQCPKCRYDIRGLPQPRCPECGEVWGRIDVR